MRMRKKKNSEARLTACNDYLIKSPNDEELKRLLPAELEIGCGKGKFICETAAANPDKHYIAVELVTEALITALERAKAYELKNLKFINLNARELPMYFDRGQIETIYLNFSDPWPKARHAKRRLTYKSFLDIYRNLLPDDGKLCFKTDNDLLFGFSIEEFKDCGWRVEDVTYDLHASEFNDNNIMTEYEKAFSEKGSTIKRLVAYVK